MGERTLRPEDMATTSTAVATVASPLQEEPVQPVAVITLRQPRAQARKKVVWTDDTVDNENMNKKKSKCCCIYEKPHRFGESDSEDSDDECEHCFGHVERRRPHHHHGNTAAATATATATATVTTTDTLDSSTEPPAEITLQPAPPGPKPEASS